MKEFAKRILLLFAAVCLFLTGMGVTVVNCHCISCDKQSIFMSAQQVCCSPKAESKKEKSCCSSGNTCHTSQKLNYSASGYCSISRLSIDIDPSSFRPHLSIPFVWISDALALTECVVQHEEVSITDEYIYLKSPPDIPPRDYLSLIAVLLI